MKRLLGLVLFVLVACARAPTYLRTHGYVGDREATLGWVLLLIALIVVVVVTGLVLTASTRQKRHEVPDVVAGPQGSGRQWILIGGVIVPVVVLTTLFIYSLTVLNAIVSPPVNPTLTIHVIGHQWWWEIKYSDASPNTPAITANEIHIPVGQPVRVELETTDVIHSFWIPELAGKTDLIPGQRNTMWLQADSVGTYWGSCAEYCGLQHAKMGLFIVAESLADFNRWLARQREPALQEGDSMFATGRAVFVRSACAACHTIRGTQAIGHTGPDLTHLADRRTIAAGTLPNTRGYLAGWIANPQALKPGNHMPIVGLSPADLHAVVYYLERLR